uniref:Uncharacterized protein n=1 Tax=Ditylenchus dipsaci TaxID=166011 RepID=A0A915CR49_9BILA
MFGSRNDGASLSAHKNSFIFLAAWGLYSMSVVILAFNRCIEINSMKLANQIFGGRKAYFWMIPPWIYALIFFSTTIDIPPILIVFGPSTCLTLTTGMVLQL